MESGRTGGAGVGGGGGSGLLDQVFQSIGYAAKKMKLSPAKREREESQCCDS